MFDVIIDKDFQELLPPLDAKAYKGLEENIIANGCMFPLITWEHILIDGYNRHAICTQHNIPYETVEMEFDTREDVIIWIISNQVDRRNLSPMQLTYYRGLHYNTGKKIAWERGRKKQDTEIDVQNGRIKNTQSTDSILGEKYKVSPTTIRRDAKVAEAIDIVGEASPDAKKKILAGDVRIEKKALNGLASAPKEEVAAIAAKIEDGTYEQVLREAKRAEKSEASDMSGQSVAAGTGSDTGRHDYESAESSDTVRSRNPGIASAITGTQYRVLLDACSTGTAAQAKRSLRKYIDMLEDVYAKL